jgi:hypothetical protein
MKQVNLWFDPHVTSFSFISPRILLQHAPRPPSPLSPSRMDPADVAMVALMGQDLFVVFVV